MTKPIFYLMVEDAGRELNARILIGYALQRRGAEVWIGHQSWLSRNFHALRAGVVLFKGNNLPQAHNMRLARRLGHRTASIEEEVFGLRDGTGKKIYDDGAGTHCDLLLVQSRKHAQKLRDELKVQPGKIRIVGNPRVDLLRPPIRDTHGVEARRIREHMGPFVLVNTNYAAINRWCLGSGGNLKAA